MAGGKFGELEVQHCVCYIWNRLGALSSENSGETTWADLLT